jgi:hypothetical protein
MRSNDGYRLIVRRDGDTVRLFTRLLRLGCPIFNDRRRCRLRAPMALLF